LKAWFCILNAKNWLVVKEKRVYGVPASAENRIRKIKPGDLLVFYATIPVKSVVGVYKATSEAYRDDKVRLWTNRLYPLRIRVEPISDVRSHLKEPIPLDRIVGKAEKIRTRFSLMGKSIIPISLNEYHEIMKLQSGSVQKIHSRRKTGASP